jgi:hypothetical protein
MSRARAMSLCLLSLACAFAALLLSFAPRAHADVFGSFSLLSTDVGGQVIYAHDVAVSADGRYVAFDGNFAGRTGVWRRSVQSGAIEPVSVGEPGTPQGNAELPSISADGRYVSFTTAAALTPEDTNVGPDVYVRDMQAGPGESQYELGSAITVGGSTAGLTYTYGPNPSFEEVHHGSIASGRSALSADGQKVVFVTTAVSNLAGQPTPALQVAVRDLQSRTTQLVSARYDPAIGGPKLNPETGQPEPVSAQEGSQTYGAVFVGGAELPSFTAPAPYEAATPVGASISADGSTVAWMGVDIGLQAPVLAGESLAPKYSEPLWRRIADGPQAPIRRVTGGSDPANPACAASGESVLPRSPSTADPCQGPFATLIEPATPGVVSGLEGDDLLPRLSGDGYAVAFLANAPLVSLGLNFGQGGDTHADLYLADMHPGLTRLQALRPLTELASGDATDLATTAPILDLGVSPNGSEIAFSTKRTQFPLGSPAYVSAPSAAPGMVELFDADLANDTLTRVTQGFEGGPSEHPHETKPTGEDPYEKLGDGALSPSFSADGNTLAFSSTASNLVYGDGNTPPAVAEGAFDGSDAFAVSRVVFGSTPASQSVSPPPGNPSLTPVWRLGVTALSRRDGSVLLEIVVPGAGTLRAGAQGAVRVKVGARAHKARRGSVRASTTVANATVATKLARPQRSGLLAMTLKLAKRYGSLASRRGGLSATVAVTFVASHRPTLREKLAITFARTKSGHSKHAAKKAGRGR